MNWDAISSVAEIIGAIAVVVSAIEYASSRGGPFQLAYNME
jgi:NAD/NADP transhydrogenase alpha subunit